MHYLKVKGSYLDIGKQIGIAFRREIKEYIDYRYCQMYSEMQEMGYKFQREDYKIYALELENCIRKSAKNEYEELVGIAQVVSLDIADIIFAIGYTDIFDLILAPNIKDRVQSNYEYNNECSTFIIERTTQKICGQNWDMDIASKKNACVMQKEYSDGLRICAVTTILGLVHMGMNNIGVSVGTANLSSKNVSSSGVVFPIVLQNILKTRNRKETLKILNKYRFVSGHYYYVMYPEDTSLLFETDANGYYEVRTCEDVFVHTNHYINAKLKKNSINYSMNSINRKKVIETYLQKNIVLSEQDIKNILSDHENGICRHSENENNIVTAASVIFNPMKKQMQVCNNSPCKGKWIKFDMNSIFEEE